MYLIIVDLDKKRMCDVYPETFVNVNKQTNKSLVLYFFSWAFKLWIHKIQQMQKKTMTKLSFWKSYLFV